MLKGRFYQALLPKWQRKLGAPKLESFTELYDQARMLEQHEKQYQASAQAQRPDKGARSDSKGPRPSKKSKEHPPKGNTPHPPASQPLPPTVQRVRLCHNICESPEHLARHCLKRSKEAPGRSQPATRTHVVQVSGPELESMLAEKWLQKETQLVRGESTIQHVTTVGKVEAVGPTLWLNVTVEGVPVNAMVDSGSEPIIISWCMLHQVFHHCRQLGVPKLKLKVPSVKLYGKDGRFWGKNFWSPLKPHWLYALTGDPYKFLSSFSRLANRIAFLVWMPHQILGYSFWTQETIHFSHEVRKYRAKALLFILSKYVTFLVVKEYNMSKLTRTYPRIEKCFFEPNLRTLGNYSLQVSPKGELYVPIQNFQQSLTRLPEGMELGQVESVSSSTMSPPLIIADVEPQSTITCSSVHTVDPDERRCRLRGILDAVNPREFQDFEMFLLENHDVFALSNDELGCTEVVQHHIDTGDIALIHQQLYRTQFSQSEKIAELIADMKYCGIVQPSSSPHS